MNVNVILDSKKVQAMLKKFPKRIEKSIKRSLGTTANKGQVIIEDRTEKGRGVHGAFKRYSAGYLDHLRKKGWPTRPDLFYTGDMMSSLFSQAKTSKLAIISFRGTKEKRKAIWNHRTRPFFDFNRREGKELRREFAKEFYRNMSRA
jgi:hypothetical protein